MQTDRGPKKTVSEQWRITAEQRQNDVNETLSDCRSELDVCNLRIQDLYQLSPEAAQNYAQEVSTYMNEQWGYHDHWFFVIGEWEHPILEISDNNITHHHQTAPIMGTAKSDGFTVHTLKEDSAPVVGLSFITHDIGVTLPSLRARLEPLAFAQLGKVTLQYIRPSGREVISTNVDEIMSALECADGILYTYTNHPNSTFYSQSSKRQERFIRDVLAIVENAMPVEDTRDIAYLHEIESRYMYVKIDGKVTGTTPSKSGKFKVTGRILGVTVPDLLIDGFGRKYESPDDLEASATGICLIIEPDSANFDMTPEMSGRVVIPIRGSNLKMSVQ